MNIWPLSVVLSLKKNKQKNPKKLWNFLIGVLLMLMRPLILGLYIASGWSWSPERSIIWLEGWTFRLDQPPKRFELHHMVNDSFSLAWDWNPTCKLWTSKFSGASELVNRLTCGEGDMSGSMTGNSSLASRLPLGCLNCILYNKTLKIMFLVSYVNHSSEFLIMKGCEKPWIWVGQAEVWEDWGPYWMLLSKVRTVLLGILPFNLWDLMLTLELSWTEL